MTKEAKIKIDEVLLQPDYAVIKRRDTLSIEKGRNTFKITNLDPELDPDSIKLIVSGTDIIIHNVRFEKEKIPLTEELERKKEEVEVKKEKIEVINEKMEDQVFWLDYFDKIREYFADFFAKGYATAKVSIQQYSEFSEFVEKQSKSHDKQKSDYTTEIEQLEDEIEKLEEEIEELEKEKTLQEKGYVLVTIDNASTLQDAQVQLEYFVNAGNWNLYYVLDHTDTVSLNKWVSITNTSAETWEDVSVTVTDKIRSDISIDEPELAYINPKEGIESEFLIPVQSITIDSRITVNNDGSPYSFEIGKESINKVGYQYYWNSYDFEYVIEVLIISLEKDYFYPAPINIFYDGIFIETINHIDFTPPNDPIAIPLREVKTFKVMKKAVDKKIEETGILNKQIELTYSYLMSITNPFDKQVPVIIHDQIPKPQKIDSEKDTSLDINVNYMNVSSTPYEIYESGLVRWEVDLQPNEERKIDFNVHLVQGDKK